MTVFQATPSTFAAMLAKARAGDTIVLGAGRYSVLTISRRHFDPPLDIISAQLAIVAGLYITESSGLAFTGLQILAGPALSDNAQAVRINLSHHITVVDCHITGGLAVNGIARSAPAGTPNASGNVRGLPSGKGINLYRSHSCTIAGNAITLFHKGIVFSGGNNLAIDSNVISFLRTTPISGSPGNNLSVTRNITHTSTPWQFGRDGDHGDRLHIWSSGVAINGLRIEDNQFQQGEHGYPMLGILIQDFGGKFIDAVVSRNMVEGAVGQGITLGGVSGVAADNTLVWSKRGVDGTPGVAPYLYVKRYCRDLTISGTRGGKVKLEAGTPASVVVRP